MNQDLQASHSEFDRRSIPPHAKETFWSAKDGHPIRRIDWRHDGKQQPRGAILFFPGRGDNYEKYLETCEEWFQAGFNVTASDWRGQAGSGRLGKDPMTGHIDDFATWVADLAFLWGAWKEDVCGPHILAGHSMGGHLVLRGLLDGAVDPDAMVLSAPMLGFVNPVPDRIAHIAAKLMCLIGDPRRPAWKWSEKPGVLPEGRQDLLTHDDLRYEDELWWRENRPELRMGPGSWGWVERAYASVSAMFAPERLEQCSTPIFVLGAQHDKLVGIEAINEAVRRLPYGELLVFGEEAHHEVLREVDAVRDRGQTAIAAFLAKIAPPEASEAGQ